MTTYNCDQCGQPATLYCLPKGSAKVSHACSGPHAGAQIGGEWKSVTALGGALHGIALANAAQRKDLGLAQKEN